MTLQPTIRFEKAFGREYLVEGFELCPHCREENILYLRDSEFQKWTYQRIPCLCQGEAGKGMWELKRRE
jgi:hypothetical protein